MSQLERNILLETKNQLISDNNRLSELRSEFINRRNEFNETDIQFYLHSIGERMRQNDMVIRSYTMCGI